MVSGYLVTLHRNAVFWSTTVVMENFRMLLTVWSYAVVPYFT